MSALPPHLLAAIAADPEADAPRLALAEWWEANGQPERAELLRLELRRDSLVGDDLETPEQLQRYRELLSVQWQQGWHREPPELPGVRWNLNRGLYEHASFNSFKAFEENAAAVFNFGPISEVHFWNLRSTQKLFTSPWLSRTRGLKLLSLDAKAVPLASVRLLAQSPAAQSLRFLALPSTPENTAILETIASSPNLANLTTLMIGPVTSVGEANPFPLEAVSTLPPRLVNLHLHNIRITTTAAKQLWTALGSRPLTRLVLLHTHLTSAAMEHFSRGNYEYLRLISLMYNPLEAEGVTRMLAAETLGQSLLRLFLCEVRLGDAGFEQLTGDRLPRLRALALRKNEVSENGFCRWVQASRWPHLTELTVEHNPIGDRGLWELGCSPNFPALRTLNQYGLPVRHEIANAVRERFAKRLPPLATPLPLPATALAGPASLPEQQADEDGLLEAMLIAPHDPVPRLVYADWLEEQGETDRAALLRLTGAPDEALLARVTPDLKANDLGGALVHSRFEHGLLYVSLQMRGMLAKTFQRDGAAWLRRHRVFGVHLLGSTKQWAKIAAMPWLQHVRMLSVDDGSLQNGDLEKLFASPHLQRLMGLNLPSNQMYHRIGAITNATTLPQLCMLYLRSNYVHSATIAQLVAWQPRKKLRILDLTYNNVGDSLGLLASHPHFDDLTTLNVHGNRFGDRGLQALVEGTRLPSLTHLHLSYNDIRDESLRLLEASALLTRLRWLDLSNIDATSESLLQLVRSPRFPATCQLRIYRYDHDEPTRQSLREILGDRLILH